MLNREIAIDQSLQLIRELRNNGYQIPKAILFGSTVDNKCHKDSDIDLAIWDNKFTGCLSVDYEPIKAILSKYFTIELHTFSEDETPVNNLFVKEIFKQGEILV
jgi:predicted nucleotidyltransferase